MKVFWSRLFGKVKHSKNNIIPKPVITEYNIDIGLRSDIGCVRATNQDHIGCVRYIDSGSLVAILADGMGGHNGGEVASQTAVNILEKSFSSEVDELCCRQSLVDAFTVANSTILSLSEDRDELKGMGTTLVVLLIKKGLAFFANVGDSRLYLFRQGSYTQLSEDHTMVAEMVKGGLLSPEDANNHPDKNVITRAVGTKSNVKISFSENPVILRLLDKFLLCSDGLYDLVTDTELMETVSTNSAQAACDILVNLAKERGGYDNISVIVIGIGDLPDEPIRIPTTRA